MAKNYEEKYAARYWGVYRADGPESEPAVAMFQLRPQAEGFVALMGGDEDLCVCRTDVRASYWNGAPGDDPKSAPEAAP
jgi:hypothetical protein